MLGPGTPWRVTASVSKMIGNTIGKSRIVEGGGNVLSFDSGTAPTKLPDERYTDVVIVGAGHAGLAASAELKRRGIAHEILERGDIANTWKHQSWDSLRLLTPNWMCRLPGFTYLGSEPDGFMSKLELTDFLVKYAQVIGAPVKTNTQVTDVTAHGSGFRVSTTRGIWICRGLILANGAFAEPSIPSLASELPTSINQYTARTYLNPSQLEHGAVLVVGGSATGVQLASEIRKSGRPVILAVGSHVRLPRRYRGKDIQWWLERTGIHNDSYREVDDIQRVSRTPSPQLIGMANSDLDLNRLTAEGVELVGRLVGISDNQLQFSGALHNCCHAADLKMRRLLSRVDDWISENGMHAPTAQPLKDTLVPANPALVIDAERKGIRSIVWATGLKPDFSWLALPVFDSKNRIRHDGGILDVPGAYILGHPFMRARKSSYIAGIVDDADFICDHMATYLSEAD